MRSVILFLPILMGSGAAAQDPEGLEFFEKKIRPLLVERCFQCHSAKAPKLKAGLRLDSREGMLKGGDQGPAIVPGRPEKSRLLEAVSYANVDLQMPPKGKLAEAEIADLAAWVKRGAPWPREEPATPAVAVEVFDLARRRDAHWSWKPLAAPPPPAVKDAAWVRDPIDRFILAKLENKGLAPAPPAAPHALLRRVTFDLTGLPPAPEEAESFAPDAYERVVDRLLQSPRFGETWGRHWLDHVRYAETRGHEFDYAIPNAWQYRDYVIRAFNADVPYAQFVTEHVAGDLLPRPRLHPTEGVNESVLATGWWYLGEWLHSPVDLRGDEMDRAANQIDVFGKAFLGLTIGCARCHDHKFDAISQKDYYALAGFLRSSSYRQVLFDALEETRAAASELRALREARERAIAATLEKARRPALDRLAAYALGRPVPRELDPALAKRWTAHLEVAAKDPQDPFHPLAARAPRKPLPREEARPGEVIVDFGALPFSEWRQDGVSFVPVRPGDLRWSAGSLAGVHSRGAAEAVPILGPPGLAANTEKEPGKKAWAASGRTLRTPTFTLARNAVYSLVRGAGHAFAVVDGYRMLEGPLHHATIVAWKDAGLQWVEHRLRDYRSADPARPAHRVHLEFTPASPDFAVFLVVQADAPPAKPGAPAIGIVQEAAEGARSTEDLAARLQELLMEASDGLAAGTIAKSPRAADLALLANWLIRHPELFGVTDLQSRLSREYEEARAALARKIPPKSRAAPAILDGGGSDEHLLARGSPRTPLEPVPRRYLEAMGGGAGDRLELARRMTDPKVTPLLPRVLVNRVWHHLLGRGLVASVDDFGAMGASPPHPGLLDHLAEEFVAGGGSVKRLVRRIVLSSAYRMSGAAPARALEIDPANDLLHHVPVRRLTAEAVRDAMLAVSGRLDPKMHGPSVPVYLDPFQDGRGKPAGNGPLDGAGRRTIYVSVRRNFLSQMLLAFDFPQPFSTMGRRSVSNVPAQALILRNHPFVHDQAAAWGRRMAAEKGTVAERAGRMFQAAYARPASTEEVEGAAAYLQEMARLLGKPADDAAVWKELAHALFQTREFILLN